MRRMLLLALMLGLAAPAAAGSYSGAEAAREARSLGGEFKAWSYGNSMSARAFAFYIEQRFSHRAYQWSFNRRMWQLEHAHRENYKRRWSWIRPTRDCNGCHGEWSATRSNKQPGTGQPNHYSDSH